MTKRQLMKWLEAKQSDAKAEVTSWTSGVCSVIGFSPSLMVRS